MGINWKHPALDWQGGGGSGSVAVLAQSSVPVTAAIPNAGAAIILADIPFKPEYVGRWFNIRAHWQFDASTYAVMRLTLRKPDALPNGNVIMGYWLNGNASTALIMAADFFVRPDGRIICPYAVVTPYNSTTSVRYDQAVSLHDPGALRLLFDASTSGGNGQANITLHGYQILMTKEPV